MIGRRRSGTGAAAAGASAAVLATAASACCVPVLAPILVSALGVSGAIWAAGLEPYSPYLVIFAGAVLGFGYFQVYRPRASAGAPCPVQRSRSARIVLFVATGAWLLSAALNAIRLVAPGFFE